MFCLFLSDELSFFGIDLSFYMKCHHRPAVSDQLLFIRRPVVDYALVKINIVCRNCHTRFVYMERELEDILMINLFHMLEVLMHEASITLEYLSMPTPTGTTV